MQLSCKRIPVQPMAPIFFLSNLPVSYLAFASWSVRPRTRLTSLLAMHPMNYTKWVRSYIIVSMISSSLSKRPFSRRMFFNSSSLFLPSPEIRTFKFLKINIVFRSYGTVFYLYYKSRNSLNIKNKAWGKANKIRLLIDRGTLFCYWW